jgi:hypothetical protein
MSFLSLGQAEPTRPGRARRLLRPALTPASGSASAPGGWRATRDQLKDQKQTFAARQVSGIAQTEQR